MCSWEGSQEHPHVTWNPKKKKIDWKRPKDYLAQAPAAKQADFKVQSALSNCYLLKLNQIDGSNSSSQRRGTAAKIIKGRTLAADITSSFAHGCSCSCLPADSPAPSQLCPAPCAAVIMISFNMFHNRTPQHCFRCKQSQNSGEMLVTANKMLFCSLGWQCLRLNRISESHVRRPQTTAQLPCLLKLQG